MGQEGTRSDRIELTDEIGCLSHGDCDWEDPSLFCVENAEVERRQRVRYGHEEVCSVSEGQGGYCGEDKIQIKSLASWSRNGSST